MITRFTLERPCTSLTILFFLFVWGYNAFLKLPRSEDPPMITRGSLVITELPGASPERVEELVTAKIEEIIQEMEEIRFIRSQSKMGLSVITVAIKESYHDMQPIWQKLRHKMERAKLFLPAEAVGPFVNDEYGDVSGQLITLRGSEMTNHQLKKIADALRSDILLIDNVAKVDIYGVQPERIFIEYRENQLEELGVTPQQLKVAFQERNIVLPGGTLTTSRERLVLEPTGAFLSIEEIENAVVRLPITQKQKNEQNNGGQEQGLSYLKDFAIVRRGQIDPPTSLLRVNGEQSLLLAITMRKGGDILALGRDLHTFISRTSNQYPIGLSFDYLLEQSETVKKSVDHFFSNLVESIVIVFISIILSLGWRTGLVVTSVIPATILITFGLMNVFSIGMDQVSLAALIISLGILVDNAIVIAEAIMTLLDHGHALKKAAILAVQELALPLFTCSVTTSIAFLPLFLAQSAVGEYTASLFKVVTIALMTSWFLSLTMTPLFCILFLHHTAPLHEWETLYRPYRRFLIQLLRHRPVTLTLFALSFFLAIIGFRFIPNIFFTSSELPLIQVSLQLSSDSKIEINNSYVAAIETFLAQRREVITYACFIGSDVPRYSLQYTPLPPSQENSYILIRTKDLKSVAPLIVDLNEWIMTSLPDVQAKVSTISFGPPIHSPVEVKLSGSNQEKLFSYITAIKEILQANPGTINVRDDWNELSKKCVARVNQERALRANVTNRDIAISLKTQLSGFEATQYHEKTDNIPIVLRGQMSAREGFHNIENAIITSSANPQGVPLRQIADLEIVWQPGTIHRYNRLRTITIGSDVRPGFTALQVASMIQPQLDKLIADLPQGYIVDLGGEFETSNQANDSINAELPVALTLTIILLVTHFNALRPALIILLTIPLGITGVVIGLLLTQLSMGFMTFLGILSLAGILVGHTIILVDRIAIERANKNQSDQESLLLASERRLRPIVLTSVTAILGLLPLWLWNQTGLFASMAVAISFGLFVATAFTLGFVPVLYSLLYGISFKKNAKDALNHF